MGHIGRCVSTTRPNCASFEDRDKKDREAVMKAQARAAGASPVSGYFFAACGILGGGWYAGWFSGKVPKELQLVQELQRRSIRVVVFDVDNVMSGAKVGDGIPRHELGEFLAKASSDFVPAIRALKQHGFKLAVACKGEDPARRQRPVASSSHEALLRGPDVAQALISQRCPEVLPSFEVMACYECRPHDGRKEDTGRRRHIRHIAKHYRVEPREVLFFGASVDDLTNEEGWIGVLCQDRREGFRFDDLLSLQGNASL